MAKWLLIDVNYLCHRAFHTTGHLTHNEIVTGVVFGFLRTIVDLQQSFDTDNVAFCFDSKHSLRREIYPAYKASRRQAYEEATEEEKDAREEFHRQVGLLRTEYLTALGHTNVFCQRGYEADDIIASIVFNSLKPSDEAVIVSSDHDLYQLIGASVSMYTPSKAKIYTLQSFKKEFGILPARWPEVKAMAGCSSDNIEGIKGVGEKTACKFITNQIKPKSKTEEKIIAGVGLMKKNMPLVRLPFVGTKTVKLKPHKVTQKKWTRLMDSLGMRSMRKMSPLARRERKR